MSIFFDKNQTLKVSRFSLSGWWLGNTLEHVASGTSLGRGFTTNVYTPSSAGMTARYDKNDDTWSDEINDMSSKPYWNKNGKRFEIGVPDGDYPNWAIKEVPPSYDNQTQTVLYIIDGGWRVYDIEIGKSYYDELGNEQTVTDYNFELPIGYTFDTPLPAKKGSAVRLIDGIWQYVVDHIGKEYWDADGTKHTISELGVEVPKEALLEAPVIPPSTEELAAQARAKRDALVDQVTREINRLEDAGKDAKAWRDYRVVLRNVPEQAGFPQEIDWGKQPAAFTGK